MTRTRVWIGLLAAAAIATIPLGGPRLFAQGPISFFPQSMAPTQDNAYDIGTATNRVRNVFVSGAIRVVPTAAPTCTTNCGTAPTVVGSDAAMRVTIGATGAVASPITITFATPFAAAPACVAQQASVVGHVANVAFTTTTTVAVYITTPANSDAFHVLCQAVS